MKPKKALQIGMPARVHRTRSYYPHLRGEVGTIIQEYGDASHRVFEVRFPDGSTKLFWDYQLEEVEPHSIN